MTAKERVLAVYPEAVIERRGKTVAFENVTYVVRAVPGAVAALAIGYTEAAAWKNAAEYISVNPARHAPTG